MKYSSLSESYPHVPLHHSTFPPGFVRNAPITARVYISPYDFKLEITQKPPGAHVPMAGWRNKIDGEGEAGSNLIYKHSISHHVNT
jgi:hypothetical protein